MTTPLIQPDDLATYLGIGENEQTERLQFFTDGASAFLLEQLGRDFSSAERTEKYAGQGTPDLVLQHYPVTELTAISVDGVALDVANADVVELTNPSAGIVSRTDGSVFPCSAKRNVEVRYTGGVPAVPDDVKLAALDLAAYVYQTTGGRMQVMDGETSAGFPTYAMMDKGWQALPAIQAALTNHGDVLYRK